FSQALADFSEAAKVGSKRNARQFAFQVGGVTLAIERVMQHCVDVMKDVPLRDRLVSVVVAELFKRPVGDVLASIRAVFVIVVNREALRSALREQIWKSICSESKQWYFTANLQPDNSVLVLMFRSW